MAAIEAATRLTGPPEAEEPSDGVGPGEDIRLYAAKALVINYRNM
jgi:hypothetical protein